MFDYTNSTFSLLTSSFEEGHTLQRMSVSIPLGQTTDWNTMLSLFQLPKEKLDEIKEDVHCDIIKT